MSRVNLVATRQGKSANQVPIADGGGGGGGGAPSGGAGGSGANGGSGYVVVKVVG
jgi:hypothetical protein